MVTKKSIWVDALNCSVRFYLDWSENEPRRTIKDIYVSVTSVIGSVLRNPVWEKLQQIHGKVWADNITDIGTHVHILLEQWILNGGEIPSSYVFDMELRFANYPDCDGNVWDKLKCLTMSEYVKTSDNFLTEKMLFNKQDGRLYAGTADLIDIGNNRLRDWKSGVYKELTLHQELQLAAYSDMACRAGLLAANDTLSVGVTCTTAPQNKFYKSMELDLDNNIISRRISLFEQLYDMIDWQSIIKSEFDTPGKFGQVCLDSLITERKKSGRWSLREQLEREMNGELL